MAKVYVSTSEFLVPLLLEATRKYSLAKTVSRNDLRFLFFKKKFNYWCPFQVLEYSSTHSIKERLSSLLGL